MSDNPHRRGRPSKLTPKIQEGICKLIMMGNFRCVAAKALGVASRTLERWMQLGREFPDGVFGDFVRAIVQAEAWTECSLVNAVTAAARDENRPDATKAMWWLERKAPKRWGRFRNEFAEVYRRLKEMEQAIHGEEVHADAGDEHSEPD